VTKGKLLMASIALASSVGFGVGAVTMSSAASNPSTTTFYACLKSGSLINVTTLTHKCAAGASAVSWNATGIAGSQGAQGPQGQIGPQGPAWSIPNSYYIYSYPAPDGNFTDPTAGRIACPSGVQSESWFPSIRVINYDNIVNRVHYWNWLCPLI